MAKAGLEQILVLVEEISLHSVSSETTDLKNN